MPWISVSFEVVAARVEEVGDALLETGALSVDVADAQGGTHEESPIFGEPGEPGGVRWPRNRVSALFDIKSDYPTLVRQAVLAAGLETCPQIEVLEVSEQDWVRLTQQQFGPIEISPRLWIVPSWCEAPVAQAINLRLDPGTSFGTGGHPTTWQCLRWLDQHLVAGDSVLDYGCGSGILSIAAKRLGAGRVLGADLDVQAVQSSECNARANEVCAQFVTPDRLAAQTFDVVMANILANPLRVLAPLLAEHTRLGGRIVLAGILDTQAERVQQAYSPWFDLSAVYPRDGWICLAGSRRR